MAIHCFFFSFLSETFRYNFGTLSQLHLHLLKTILIFQFSSHSGGQLFSPAFCFKIRIKHAKRRIYIIEKASIGCTAKSKPKQLYCIHVVNSPLITTYCACATSVQKATHIYIYIAAVVPREQASWESPWKIYALYYWNEWADEATWMSLVNKLHETVW